MELINEIIAMASDGKRSVADALRKCLILSYELKNEALREWVEKELNGYSYPEPLPSYRDPSVTSKGTFSGPFGASVVNQPLPTSILEEKHRDLVERAYLGQPIASYEAHDKNATIDWPTNLTHRYQHKFIQGYGLAHAWQVIPSSCFVGIVDTVRNRVLKFALEIRQELGEVNDAPSAIEPAKVQAAVINNIYGGQVVIGGSIHDFAQIGQISICQGDFEGLSAALRTIDVPIEQITELKQILLEEAKRDEKTLGQKTLGWLKRAGGAGVAIGTHVTKQVATKWVMQYLGLPM